MAIIQILSRHQHKKFRKVMILKKWFMEGYVL